MSCLKTFPREVNDAFAHYLSGCPFAPILDDVSLLLQQAPVQVFRDHTAGIDALSGDTYVVGSVAASGE
jgi:hypothetical protein